MDELPPLRWSTAVQEADWIAERLSPFGQRVTSVVPSGFEAYARILHPILDPGDAGPAVRWREVAAWSGIELRPDAQFHAIALPSVPPERPPPWRGQGPRQGQLFTPDALVLAEVLRSFTTTPEACFFGLWAGYGFPGIPLVSVGSPPAGPLPDAIPSTVRDGPLVRLPHREYWLYTGGVEAIVVPAAVGHGQSANLAWPTDRAWCVATEIDLSSTYVGGSAALIERLVTDSRIEALPASPDDPVTGLAPVVADLVDAALEELLAGGHVRITTSMGTVEAWLEHPTEHQAGVLRTRSERFDGSRGSGGASLHHQEDLRRTVCAWLAGALVDLVGG